MDFHSSYKNIILCLLKISSFSKETKTPNGLGCGENELLGSEIKVLRVDICRHTDSPVLFLNK